MGLVLRKSLENQIANLEESLTEMETNYNKVAKREIEKLEQKVGDAENCLIQEFLVHCLFIIE